MAKGENIFKRKDGRWEARYIKGRELSGKIRYGFCYGKTYAEAKEKVTRIRAAMLSGAPAPAAGPRHRFAHYCDEWLLSVRSKVKESTYVKYDAILRKHIKPKLGACFPLSLSTALVESFARELLYEDALSPKTVKDILGVLRSVLGYTAKHFPDRFPAVEITPPKEFKKEMRVLTREEQDRLVQYLLADIDPCKFGVLLALFTGIRIGEVCALRWEDLSAAESTLHIGATIQRIRDLDGGGAARTKLLVSAPKSKQAVRTIPLTAQTAMLCAQMRPSDPHAYVLTGSATPLEPRTMQYHFKRYTEACGLEGVHFHTLRHTFATRCVEVGFEIKTLSEILGHASTSITLERYVHSSIELKRRNMEKLTAIGL